MAMTLYAGSGSPFAWRVWLALEHKKIPYELKMLSFSEGDLKKPAFLALNPRGKVPVITDGDFTLFESAAIMEYLDEAYPGNPLFPGDAKQRALTRRMQQEVANYVDEPIDGVFAELFWNEGPPDEAALKKAREQIVKELEYFEQQIRGDFLAGPLSAADYSLYTMLALGLRAEQKKKPDLGLGAALGPKLKAWKARIEALPYFDKTYPPHWR